MDLIKKHYQVSDPVWERIKAHTVEDPELRSIMTAVQCRWENPVARALKPYFHFRSGWGAGEGIQDNNSSSSTERDVAESL